MDTSQSLQALDLDALVGQPVADAQAAVEAAGGATRIVAPGDAVTLDYRPDRVTILAEDGRVVERPTIG